MSQRVPLVVVILVICAIVGISFASVSASVLATRTTSPAATRPLTTYAFTSITTGLFHSCALTSVGSIFCWGLNSAGQLGSGNNISSALPVLVKTPPGVTFNRVQANGNHTCAKSTTNALYCWGNNASGQLGIGSTTNKNLPTAVLAPTGVTFADVYVGYAHTCGLTGSGGAYCWGINDYGNLGTGSKLQRTSPALVLKPSGVSFAHISGGQYHTCARTTTNRAYCWGENIYGRLGDGTTTSSVVPVAVTMPIGITFTEVSAGGAFSCANTSAGNAYCWGFNVVGQLGIGSSIAQNAPTAVTMPASITFSQLSAGGQHGCATTPANTAYCWGLNSSGQLGNGTQVNSNIPIASTLPSGILFSSISAGGEHTCAITTANDAYCWGRNNQGQLGDGTTTNRNAPVLVVMPIMPTATPTNTSTITRTNTATRSSTRTHTGTMTRSSTRTATSTRTQTSTHTATFTRTNTFTRTATGTATGTRTNTFTRTATGTRTNTFTRTATNTATATRTATVTRTATDTRTATNTATATRTHTATSTITPSPAPLLVYNGVESGGANTCALVSPGNAYCWGGNYFGQLGNGTNGTSTKSSKPVAVIMPTGVLFSKISSSALHTCALSTTGIAYCWGWGTMVGDGTGVDSNVPTPVTMPAGITFKDIVTASELTCALSIAGEMYCWGDAYTNIPTLQVNPSYSSVRFSSLSTNITDLTVCALDAAGDAYCWGINNYGQTGNGNTNSVNTPDPVIMPAGVHFRDISSGRSHTCATTTDQQAVYCWGLNNFGQLGNGTTTNSLTPVAVNIPSTLGSASWDVDSISLGDKYTCVTSVHGTYCWGENTKGQLGNGTTSHSNVPVRVQVPNVVSDILVRITTGWEHTCAVTSATKTYCWGDNSSGQVGDNTTTNRSIPVLVVQP